MRVYNNKIYDNPSFIEKIICAASYLTGGLIGFAWLIIGFLMKKNLKPFVAYHVYQAIFLSILVYVVQMLVSIIFGFLNIVPILGTLTRWLSYIFTNPAFWGFSVIHLFLLTVVMYLALGALVGRYTYVPFISDIINSNVGGRR